MILVLVGSWTGVGFAFEQADPGAMGLDVGQLNAARDYALTGGGAGKVIYRGKDVFRWGDQRKCYDLKSTSKSIGLTALGVAMREGRMSLSDQAIQYQPDLGVPPDDNRDNPWRNEITLFHLATQTAGFEKPGGYTKLVFAPGTKWNYSDGGPNWLAECITLEYRRDIQELLFNRVFTPIGIKRSDLRWRDNAYRSRDIEGIRRCEFGSGVLANVEAMARIGWLYRQRGQWQGRQLISASFVSQAARTPEASRGLPVLFPEQYNDASNHYGLLWWNNHDGTLPAVPREAFWSWGLYDSIILVAPGLDLVAVRTGDAGVSWKRRPQAHHYEVLKPFFEPLVRAVPRDAAREGQNRAPYPASPVISQIVWDPPETIVRRAEGSDNWPLTWGDDDALYTAYGDGWGFEPKVEKKLSLGLAKVLGGPDDVRGINIRSATAEQTGPGPAGKKASGLLMVDGVLYLLVRNAGNSQLMWSTNRGETWTPCDWRFTESMGCPTFLNFGRNYAGSRDGYVYLYSPDSDSAYTAADGMILARVSTDQIRRRQAYEFYAGIRGDRPVWSRDIARRLPVFVHAGRCRRSSVCYHPQLKRYLWWQGFPTGGDGPDEQDARFAGGFGIYDAPEPWGPWTTAFFTERWDVAPGESASIPTRWLSADGRTLVLVFSGRDSFCVRQATIHRRDSSY
ncbi:MAG: serine hydrolase [Sedimentisphaerales bacterium]|nr:serine hydrolase [Sedimentisphaerales bacterium]